MHSPFNLRGELDSCVGVSDYIFSIWGWRIVPSLFALCDIMNYWRELHLHGNIVSLYHPDGYGINNTVKYQESVDY